MAEMHGDGNKDTTTFSYCFKLFLVDRTMCLYPQSPISCCVFPHLCEDLLSWPILTGSTRVALFPLCSLMNWCLTYLTQKVLLLNDSCFLHFDWVNTNVISLCSKSSVVCCHCKAESFPNLLLSQAKPQQSVGRTC